MSSQEAASPPARELTLLRTAVTFGLIALGAAALALGLAVLRARQAPELPVLGELPDFELTESRGQKVGLSDLRGRAVVASFIFTRCGGPCPMITARMAELQKRFAGREGLRLLSVSVDPAYDTPEVLRTYAERHGAEPERWWFLTGTPEAVARLSREGFRLAAETQGESPEDIIHSTRLVLLDGEGRIRGYYESEDAEARARLTRDLDGLLAHAS
jgi:protein SCO1